MSRGRRLGMRVFEVAAAVSVAIFMGAPVEAQQGAAPADPATKAAFDVLEKHCARCHQADKLVDRERPAKNFGNILQLDEIASNPNLILPGNPHNSKLFTQIVRGEMPEDAANGIADRPSEQEITALASWIESLGNQQAAACDPKEFMSSKDVVALISSDLDKMSRGRAIGTRYLTLTNLKNACVAPKAMEAYRQGAVKLINSLSRSSSVVRLETIDPQKTIIRINLNDVGWSAADWDTVLAAYPYRTRPETNLTSVMEKATGTKLPYVRADWFANKASRPGLYEKLLKLSDTFQGLARDQGVDIEQNLKNFVAQRAGFQRSGVSRNNRLIERHDSKSGYFWTSYDFAGNRDKQSLFLNPLGPSGENGFQHDGGESIFSLPNGFQAYYLNDAAGRALQTGPTNIVQDPEAKDLAVTNGISCMGCHADGMRMKQDEIRNHVINDRSFPRQVRDAVAELYPPTEKMDRVLADDQKRFFDAMARAGLDPMLRLNKIEVITALSKRYEDDLDLKLGAAEFGMTPEQFVEAVSQADRKLKQNVRRLEQGALPRDHMEEVYLTLARDITDEEVVEIGNAVAKPEVAKTAGKAFDLSITSDKNVYKQGDRPVFTAVASRDCFLTLYNVDSKGEGTVIFPNRFQQENRVRAKVEIQLPGANAGFQFRLKDLGSETVTAVCTARKADLDGVKHDFTRQAFTSVGNFTRTVARSAASGTRAIAVDPAPAQRPATTPAAAQTAAALNASEITQSAIKIEVR